MHAFFADSWLGNAWPCIDIEPADDRYLLPVLFRLAYRCAAAFPELIDLITGWAADWTLLASAVMVHLDAWTFSIALTPRPAIAFSATSNPCPATIPTPSADRRPRGGDVAFWLGPGDLAMGRPGRVCSWAGHSPDCQGAHDAC